MAYSLAGALGVDYDKECWKTCYYNRPESEGSYAANERCIAQCSTGSGTVTSSVSQYKWWLIGAGVLVVGGIAVAVRRK